MKKYSHFSLKNFLLRHHGAIDTINLSYAKTDTPKDPEAYQKWFDDTNKSFRIKMDLQHTEQKIEDFTDLLPYLNLEVCCWDLYEINGESILEVDLQ